MSTAPIRPGKYVGGGYGSRRTDPSLQYEYDNRVTPRLLPILEQKKSVYVGGGYNRGLASKMRGTRLAILRMQSTDNDRGLPPPVMVAKGRKGARGSLKPEASVETESETETEKEANRRKRSVETLAGLGDLCDVSIRSPENGDLLTFHDGKWKAREPRQPRYPFIPERLEHLINVDGTHVPEGSVLVKRGRQWVPEPLPQVAVVDVPPPPPSVELPKVPESLDDLLPGQTINEGEVLVKGLRGRWKAAPYPTVPTKLDDLLPHLNVKEGEVLVRGKRGKWTTQALPEIQQVEVPVPVPVPAPAPAPVGPDVEDLVPGGTIEEHKLIEDVVHGRTYRLGEGEFYYQVPKDLPIGTTITFLLTSASTEGQIMLSGGELLRGTIIGVNSVISSRKKSKTNSGTMDFAQFNFRREKCEGSMITLKKINDDSSPQWTLYGFCPLSNVGIDYNALEGTEIDLSVL